MMHRSTVSAVQVRPSLSDLRAIFTAGFLTAALLAATLAAHAQDAAPATTPAATVPADASSQPAAPQATTPAATQPASAAISNQKPAKTRKEKEEKVVASKDTKKEDKKTKKDDALVGMDSKLPDKALYDKAEDAVKHGRYDVARLLLQDLLNTYQESAYMMRAKLAIADSWYKEGGTAALTQAEQEYKDFITFFPNAPEAAEAQMRVGDIYFKQMDKPDRDYSNATHAEEEYRLMLEQFPDSILAPQAKQHLREVEEVLAGREADIANFYLTRQPPNWPAAIARYQTVVDTYPLYSHMDEVLLGLGDAYAAEARFYRPLNLPAAAKEHLISLYEHEAAAAYDKIVLEHPAAPHVEDARDRLVGMGLPVPTPTAEQMAASEALESSRGQYTLSKRAFIIFGHQADTVQAATTGEPPLEDAKPTMAPDITRKSQADYLNTMNGVIAAQRAGQAVQPAAGATPPADNTTAQAAPAPVAAAQAAPAAAPLAFEDVPTATANGSSSTVTNVPVTSQPGSASSNIGVEIVQPTAGSTPVTTAPATPPAFPGGEAAPAAAATTAPGDAAPAAKAPAQTIGGIGPVGPPDTSPMAPIEKPAVAPTPINEAAASKQPAAQAPPANGKKPKVECDKDDESCSRHKKKKGLAKLNPF